METRVRYKLIDIEKGSEVRAGDIVSNFRHQEWVVDAFRLGATGYGKVQVHEPGNEKNVREFNASIFGLIVKEEGQTKLHNEIEKAVDKMEKIDEGNSSER